MYQSKRETFHFCILYMTSYMEFYIDHTTSYMTYVITHMIQHYMQLIYNLKNYKFFVIRETVKIISCRFFFNNRFREFYDSLRNDLQEKKFCSEKFIRHWEICDLIFLFTIFKIFATPFACCNTLTMSIFRL